MSGAETVLPIYLDSLFFPQLLDDHFLTEVHAVNSENEDVGVVFCEMQSREQEVDDLAELHMGQLLYPGINGFNVQTGGLLADLRKPENNMAAVRSYHAEAYRPENTMVDSKGRGFFVVR